MNFKSFIVPVVTLVVGLIVGLFIGFGVTNKELDVDWKSITPIFAALIASSIAAATALYISNKWSGQKGGEVIAGIAKSTLNNSAKLAVYLDNFLKYRQNYTDDSVAKRDTETMETIAVDVIIDLKFLIKFIEDPDVRKALGKLKDSLEALEKELYKANTGGDNTLLSVMDWIEENKKEKQDSLSVSMRGSVNYLREISMYRIS